MPQKSTLHLPQKGRFSLPEVLDLVKPFGCTRTDLFEYLRSGQLRAVCYPYRLEPDREVPVEPDEWPEWFRDAWEFAVYADHIGDMDIAEHQTPIPLHIVPRAARPDAERKLPDGKPAAATATVYVVRAELQRFAQWLQDPSRSRPGPRRPGAGRPIVHGYSKIDDRLEMLFQENGRAGFERASDVTAYLRVELGKAALPPDSSLRNHIKKWLEKRTAPKR